MNNILLVTEKNNKAAKVLLEELVGYLQCKIGGYWVKITKDKANKDVRLFDLTSLYDKDENNIFFIKNDVTVRSKLNLEIFNTKGKEILERSFRNTNIIVMNEIGFLESKAFEFTSEVKRILDSSKVVLAVVKELNCNYIQSIISREDVKVFKVTEENIKATRDEVINLLKEWKVALNNPV